MVLLDDNYASIVAAVEQGRVIYANIRKTVYYLLSCTFAEILHRCPFGLACAPHRHPAFASKPAHGWSAALALGMEAAEPGIMERPPRSPKERIINREMARGIAYQAGALTAAVLGLYALAYHGAWRSEADILAFVTLVVAELFRAYAARSEWIPLLKLGPFTNRLMQWAFLTSLLILLFVVYVPPAAGVQHPAPHPPHVGHCAAPLPGALPCRGGPKGFSQPGSRSQIMRIPSSPSW